MGGGEEGSRNCQQMSHGGGGIFAIVSHDIFFKKFWGKIC